MATKKNNTAVPPVIEGETFASLQIAKNMDTDMEAKLKLLYKLQKTDSKIDQIYLLRGELPLEVQDLEDDVAGLETRIANANKAIEEGEAFIAQKKHDIVSSKALIEKYEAENAALEDRIRQLTDDRDSLERFAREELQFAAPGDDVYIIPEK